MLHTSKYMNNTKTFMQPLKNRPALNDRWTIANILICQGKRIRGITNKNNATWATKSTNQNTNTQQLDYLWAYLDASSIRYTTNATQQLPTILFEDRAGLEEKI